MAALALGLAACEGAALAASTTPDAPASALPAERFVSPPDMDRPRLSPQGDALAVLVRDAAGRRELAVIDISNPESLKMNIAGRRDNADVVAVDWVDDTRLVFAFGHELESLGDNRGQANVWAVDRTGGQLRALHDEVGGMLHDGSGNLLAYKASGGSCYGNSSRFHCEGGFSLPLRLDTRTGVTHPLANPPLPDHPVAWHVDGAGQVRAVSTQEAGEVALYVPPAGAGPWKKIAHYRVSDAGPGESFGVQGMGADGRFYVTQSSAGDKGADTLRVMDLATGKIAPDAVVSIKGFDFTGSLVQDWAHHKVLGVHYAADASGSVWFDADMQALQDRIDTALPGLINQIDVADCGCAQRVLVTSWSDRQPMQFRLFDRKTGQVTMIGGALPDMAASQMARTTFDRITARDGHELPVYMTRPAGKGPWPTVVVVHGGPFLRGWQWAWDPESQFLASRGYLVVKPEYRGSTGYGNEVFYPGMKQWGLKMQDDIADATTWAAKKGWSDASRVCIEGGSYGGYATLMGLVRYPELYRCGIASAAVTDLLMMFDVWWSDANDEWKNFGMPVMVGDPVKDADQFARTSPIVQASRITRPLMLAHGGLDRRVPIEHAERLHDALVAAHAPVTWVVYRDEGHGWFKPDNRADWFRRMEAFLAANDGPLPAKP